MSRVIHFEISAEDPERATRFYSNVFGWKIQKWDGPEDYWMATTGEEGQPGIDGAIMRRSDLSTGGNSVINTMDAESVDELAAKIEQAGGRIVAPKMAVPGVGYFAYCQDTEGNTFGIMQADPSAS